MIQKLYQMLILLLAGYILGCSEQNSGGGIMVNPARGEPTVVDVKDIPDKTLQTGLMTLWLTTMPVKGEIGYEDEDEHRFERRKDIHDYTLGYVNREAIEDPLVDKAELFGEFAKQKEIIMNYLSIIMRNRAK